jgi:hypothetical protein
MPNFDEADLKRWFLEAEDVTVGKSKSMSVDPPTLIRLLIEDLQEVHGRTFPYEWLCRWEEEDGS